MRKSLLVAAGVIIVLAILVHAFNVPLPRTVGRTLESVGVAANTQSQAIRTTLQRGFGWNDTDGEQAELTRLRLQTIENERLREQNRQLRDELDFARTSELATRHADVVNYHPDPTRDLMRINAGQNDGVEPGMPVVAQSVLVGTVTEVSATTADVVLVTDGSFRALAEVNNRTEGVVRGQVGSSIVMEQLPREDNVSAAAIVTTSGQDGDFPPGLLIGTVRSVAQNPGEVFDEAQIRPELSYRDLHVVTVLLQP